MLNKYIGILTLSLTLAMFNQTLIVSSGLRYTIYAFQLYCAFWLLSVANRYRYNPLREKSVQIVLGLLFFNFVFSPYDPNFTWLIKYFSYVLSFGFGVIIYKNDVLQKVNKLYICVLVFLPLFLVGFIDKTPHKNMFFILSNTYSFTGLSISLLVYTLFINKKNAFLYSASLLFLYVISCSSLGIVGAIILSVLFINRWNSKLLLCSAVGFVLFGFLVVFSDIEVFKRIRDVYMVLDSMDNTDWLHVRDLNLYDLTAGMNFESERSDNTSLVWRVAQWAGLLVGYFENWYYSILFGLGDSYTLRMLGNYPHNDYLRVLCEYGLIVFIIIIKWLRKVVQTLSRDVSLYYVLAYFFYFFTENIIDTFVANSIMFMCIGYHYARCKNKNIKTIGIKIKKNENRTF